MRHNITSRDMIHVVDCKLQLVLVIVTCIVLCNIAIITVAQDGSSHVNGQQSMPLFEFSCKRSAVLAYI